MNLIEMSIADVTREKIYRFYKSLKYSNDSDCWEYTPAKGQRYGRVYLKRDKQNVGAHRLSYLIYHRSLPANQLVLHKCDNTKCVNPTHLFLGTQRDNVHDMIRKGRQRPCNRGVTHCRLGHAFDETNTVWYKDHKTGAPKRYCKRCEKIRDRDKVRRRQLKAMGAIG